MLRRLKQLRRRSKTVDSVAVLKVFAIPELLEEILLYLPLKQLFAVQRVSKVFRDTIAASDPLKRRMFLAYPTTGSTSARPATEDLINPLLRYNFGSAEFYSVSYFIFRWYDYPANKWCFLQTAGSNIRDVSRIRDRKLKHAWGWKENYIPYESIRQLPADRDESWKKTKLTAVPCLVDATIGVTTMQRGYSRQIRFHDGTGTLGDFEKCVKEFVSLTDEQHAQQHDRRLLRFVWRGPGNLQPVYGDPPSLNFYDLQYTGMHH